MEQTFLTVHEFAVITRRADLSVRRGIDAGTIPAVKLGGRILIPSSFIMNLEQAATASIAGRV